MKKVVIGLRLQYVPYALGASLLSVIALFLPLVTAEGKSVSILSAALQAEREWTPEEYVRCHPGGKLGQLRENEK